MNTPRLPALLAFTALGALGLALSCSSPTDSDSDHQGGGTIQTYFHLLEEDCEGAYVVVGWGTSNPSTSEVMYGQTHALGQSMTDSDLKTNHRFDLIGVDQNAFIYYRLKSVEDDGSEWMSRLDSVYVEEESDVTEPPCRVVQPKFADILVGDFEVLIEVSDEICMETVEVQVGDYIDTLYYDMRCVKPCTLRVPLSAWDLEVGTNPIIVWATDKFNNTCGDGVFVTVCQDTLPPEVEGRVRVFDTEVLGVPWAGVEFETNEICTVEFNHRALGAVEWNTQFAFLDTLFAFQIGPLEIRETYEIRIEATAADGCNDTHATLFEENYTR